MTQLMIYIWLKLDTIHGTLSALFWCVTMSILIIVVISSIYWFVEGKPHEMSKKLPFKSVALTLLTLLALSIITPTTKQAAVMFGVPYLINNAKEVNLDKLPVKVVDYLNAYLDNETKKLMEVKK